VLSFFVEAAVTFLPILPDADTSFVAAAFSFSNASARAASSAATTSSIDPPVPSCCLLSLSAVSLSTERGDF